MARSSHSKVRWPFPSPSRRFVQAKWYGPERRRLRDSLRGLVGAVEGATLDDVAIENRQARSSAKSAWW